MTLVLKVSDDADATGATATITGSTAGATNQLYVWAWRLGALTGEWSLAGSRTGDGTIAAALPVGLYWAHLRSTAGTVVSVSQIVTFGVTTGQDPLHYRIAYAVRDVVLALNLHGITDDKVRVLKRALRVDNFIGREGVIISPVTESLQPHDNARSEYGPAVQVTLYRASNQVVSDDNIVGPQQLAMDMDDRFRTMFALTETSLPGVSEVARVAAYPGQIILPQGLDSQWDVSGIVFRCTCFVNNQVYSA